MEHINIDTIQSYLEGRSKDPDTEAHLATCQRCHGLFMELRSLENMLGRSFPEGKAKASCPEDWEIAPFVKGEIAPESTEGLSAHIKDCSFCMERSAVYFKALYDEACPAEAPQSWKENAARSLKKGRAKQETRVSMIQRILSALQRFRESLTPMPAYAVAAVAIALFILTVLPDQGKIVTLASSQKIMTRDSEVPSALGFTGAGEVREVSGMEIRFKGKDIIFVWEPIEGSGAYDFSIRQKQAGEVVYSAASDNAARVTIKQGLLEKEKLYSWLITGKTHDNRYFEYTGDFVRVK